MIEELINNKLTVTLTRERETKNTVRYAEEENTEGLPPAIGTLYVQKYAARRLGSPERIRIVITKE